MVSSIFISLSLIFFSIIFFIIVINRYDKLIVRTTYDDYIYYWLKIASSKNYHHFFPKAYLIKKGVAKAQYDVITNITLVDDYLN